MRNVECRITQRCILRQWQPQQPTVKNKKWEDSSVQTRSFGKMDEYCSELYKDKDATNPMVAEVDKKFELMLTRRAVNMPVC